MSPSDTDTTARNAEVVRRHYRFSNEGDWSKVEQQFAEDVTLYEADGHPCPGEWRGIEALREGGAGVVESLGLSNVEPITLMSHENMVAALIEATVQRQGGEPFKHQIIELWTLNDDGLITEIRPFYYDLTVLRKGLGLS